MRQLLVLALAGFALAAQTNTVTLTLTVPSVYVLDMTAHWLGQNGGQIATLGASIGPSDTTITVTGGTFVAGQTLLIESEAIPVVAANGQSLTVSRGSFSLAAPHAAGAAVAVLTYATPIKMILAEALRPYFVNIVQQQAAKGASAALPDATGTITVQ